MSRRVLIASVLLAVAGFAAAVVLPDAGAGRRYRHDDHREHHGHDGDHDDAHDDHDPKKKPPIPVAKSFPAAGGMLVNSVPVRVAPNPHAHVIKVMHQFRSDYRPQEMLAVGVKTGSDGEAWYRISIPMRPNGTYGWIPAKTV